jgi:hypothetical protein
LNKVDYSNVNIPKYWKLSKIHNKDLKDIIGVYYKNLKQFYGVTELQAILEEIQIKCQDIQELVYNTPLFAAFNDGKEEVFSIFDERLVNLLYRYYILLIFHTYIQLINISTESTTATALPLVEEISIEPDTKEVKIELEEVPPTEVPPAELSFIEEATIAGAKKEITSNLSMYLITICEMLCDDKDAINYDKEIILNKILNSKEKEKDEITEYLKDLTDEERAVENIFKQHKLEKWGKGLQKGLTQYVQENYDEERETAEKELLKERELSKKTGINEYNKDIYSYEFDADAALAEEIDREVDSLTDYPGEDGDEPAYGNDPEDYENY